MRHLLALCAACGAPQPARPAGDLVGLWGAETVLTTQTAGHLVLRRHADVWTATIGTASSVLKLDDGWFRADLGNGEVRLRVRDGALEAF